MFSYQIDENLTIRLLTQEDTDELYTVIKRNQKHLSEWLSWAEELADIDTYRNVLIPEWRYKYAEQKGFDAGIFLNGHFCGMISVHNLDTVNHKAEIGYWLDRNYEGRGMITACCRAVIAHAFYDLGLNRIMICAAEKNAKSRAIPERLGFQREGLTREGIFAQGRYHDSVNYSMLRREWNTDK
ncbi:GNAT family N-acetyltransferase [Bacillus nakamurai]|uniref:GNAT family N-acetyltransferase n=1 Tax=Bacillus nakamurai TaxID=1793963 RepID=UPI001E2B2946|nr:GNAT family protein [Bacillus nakamurai]MCC9023390.1 GNAT family N-acetyltransferase [Bacillus nakamurai]